LIRCWPRSKSAWPTPPPPRPSRQKDEGRNCDDYAQRTARYAYSAAGGRQAEQLAKYRQQWERLEGREPQWQQEQAKARTVERDNSPGLSL
jgi:hypothetical protein